ncbi:MAG: hypothetical protein OXD50_01735 [Chloroflexi bacterium]|nr:hypothetical protein [Chloroflexota bacterium]
MNPERTGHELRRQSLPDLSPTVLHHGPPGWSQQRSFLSTPPLRYCASRTEQRSRAELVVNGAPI